MKPTVYFTPVITAEKVVELMERVGVELPGRVAVKFHSGEKGNQNFLGPDMWRAAVERVHGTAVECNTAYDGSRNTTERHIETMHDHGWSDAFTVDIMDSEGPDLELPVRNGKRIHKNLVGRHLANYDSLLVLSHFKGHPMGGYGGALKQLSIGIASSAGKVYIHGAGDMDAFWTSDHDSFLESMADAASSVVDFFGGRALYINVLANLSVDCDCCAVAEDPCMRNIGIAASCDPVAIDQACIDLVTASDDPGKEHFLERVNSSNGIHTIEAAAALGIGSREYELVRID